MPRPIEKWLSRQAVLAFQRARIADDATDEAVIIGKPYVSKLSQRRAALSRLPISGASSPARLDHKFGNGALESAPHRQPGKAALQGAPPPCGYRALTSVLGCFWFASVGVMSRNPKSSLIHPPVRDRSNTASCKLCKPGKTWLP
jgi:hypothetical protein